MPLPLGHAVFVYSEEQLIALMSDGILARPVDTPPELWRKTHQGCSGGKQRRGMRGGSRQDGLMERRRFEPCLHSVVMGNVRCLSNKMDKAMVQTRSHTEYRECSMMCFTETWLHRDITDQSVSVDGFHTIQADQDCTESGKWKGRGLAVLVT